MGAYKRKRPIRLPTDRQLARVLGNLNPKWQLILILMLKMGLRRDEVARLKLSDFQLGENPTLTFIGKGGKQAVLPIPDEVLGYIERALRERPDLPHEFAIWSNHRKDKGISNSGINYIVSTSGERAGVDLYPHLLRHKFAHDMLAATGDVFKTKEACRHERVTTTADVYGHQSFERQRDNFELLDRRPWPIRFLSRFKPPIPVIFSGRKVSVFIGETVGRQTELAVLKTNRDAGIHSILCGPRGSGKSHLLRLMTGPWVYRLEDLKPPRERLVELVEQMKADGAFVDDVSGKSTSKLLKSLFSAVDGKKFILIIDTLDTLTADGIALLRKLKDRFVIFSAIDEKYRSRVKEIFFGGCEILDIRNLPADDAMHLADAASADIATTPTGREQWLRRVAAESQGNPQAIVEIVDRERRRGRVVGADAEIVHEASQEPLPATPILSALALIAVISRYGASSVGRPDLKIILIVAAAVVLTLVLIDRILKQGVR